MGPGIHNINCRLLNKQRKTRGCKLQSIPMMGSQSLLASVVILTLSFYLTYHMGSAHPLPHSQDNKCPLCPLYWTGVPCSTHGLPRVALSLAPGHHATWIFYPGIPPPSPGQQSSLMNATLGLLLLRPRTNASMQCGKVHSTHTSKTT